MDTILYVDPDVKSFARYAFGLIPHA